MAFIETVPPEGADGALAVMYLRQQSAWGYIPNYAKVFCYRPEVMARWGQLLAEIKRPMGKRRFELVTFTFSRQTARDASSVSAAQVASLRQHGYTDAEVFDIAAPAAGRAFFSKLLDALGVTPDSPFLAYDESFRRALTVGRAIDVEPCVTMPVTLSQQRNEG